ncbi:MAG: TRAP transporter substrate-binding protein [Thiotrichaceae bacterium]|nr:TRAP transporter substrate-binding protein [Thiotrichaceae bacterium]
MVTTWPKNFPGLGTGANNLAEKINQLSGGRLQVKVYGSGELVPAMETFDAVSRGTAQMGHGAAYYWKGKNATFQFFSTVPFGLTAQEMNGWLYNGGGLELWQEAYAKHNLIPMPAGNMGVQMGGWFNKEIKTIDDLKGLKMRIPGLGGEVLNRAGGTPVNLPGGELYSAMQSGTIDATEWVGPYNDLAFGFHKVAKYYYFPGWHEPGTSLEAIINKEAFSALPKDLQAIVLNACKLANHEMLAEYTARNNDALVTLVEKHQVQIKRFPDDVLNKLRSLSDEVVAELAKKDAFSQKVFDSYSSYRKKVMAWHEYSERAYLNVRAEK